MNMTIGKAALLLPILMLKSALAPHFQCLMCFRCCIDSYIIEVIREEAGGFGSWIEEVGLWGPGVASEAIGIIG